jgi:hypothetical protein
LSQSAEDDEGLEFYDPKAAAMLAKAEALRDREINQPQMVKLNGKLVPASVLN